MTRSSSRECIFCEGLGRPARECSPDHDTCVGAVSSHCRFGDHRRCLLLDTPGCDTKASLPRVIDVGLEAVRESGEPHAIVALEADGGTKVWGTARLSKDVNRIRFKAYRHYGVKGLGAHGVVFIVREDDKIPLI